MPTILETDIGEIEMPDNWSADQIKEWAHTRLPNIRQGLKKGRAADLASRIPRDLATAGATVIQGAERGRQMLVGPTGQAPIAAFNRRTGEPVSPEVLIAAEAAAKRTDKQEAEAREAQLAKSLIYKFGEQTKEAAREVYAVNPTLENSVLAKLSAAAASTIPVLAAAPGGPVAMGATYAAMSGQQGAEEAIAEGRPDKADEAYLAYAGLGALSEAALGYPMALIRTLRAARKAGVPPKTFGEAVKAVVKESGKGTIREAAQESSEQFGQNVAARLIGFDPDRELSQGVRDAAIYGGAVGGLFGGGFGAAQAVDARRAEQANQPANQIDRLLRENRLDLRPIDPRLADLEAREAMRPENAQRTVIPAMLDQPGGWAVGEDGTRLADLTLTPPTSGTETAPPAPPAPPAEPPRRRVIVPAPESPRFRPSIAPNVPPVPEREKPVRPPTVAPVAPPVAPGAAGAPAETEPSGIRLPPPPPGFESAITTIKRGEVGGMLGSKEVVTTSSGRTTTPFPDVKTDTERKSTATIKKVDAWLRENAIAEATARGDEFNSLIFSNSNPKSLSQADKDSMEEYMFGTQPKVVPSILKPISQPSQQTPVTPEVPSAVPIRKAETLSPSKTPEDRPPVGTQIRPTETAQVEGQVEPEKKAAEEAFESELVVKARQIVQQSASPEQAFDNLVQFYEQMPRLGTRTAASKTAQAYSTPPPLAFLGGHLIGIQAGTKVGEPTAGNGMLFIGANPQSTLIANELDPNRNARLKSNFPQAQVSILDATSSDFFDYLSQWKPDRLTMNPPFGGRVDEGSKVRFPIFNAATSKTETPSIDLAIALNSLETMAPDGRAVIIIGSKTGTMGPQFGNDSTRAKDYNRPEMLEFFARFNVTDWFTVSGKLYEKMGAGWPVDVIVINGKRPTAQTSQGGFQRPWVKPPKVYNSWAELKEKLNETTITSESTQAQPAPPSIPGRRLGGSTGGAGGAPVRPAGGTRPGDGRTTSVPEQSGVKPAVPQPTRLPEQEKPKPEDSRPPVIPPSRPEPTPPSSTMPGDARRTGQTGTSTEPLGEGSNTLNVSYNPISSLGGSNLVAPRNLSDAMARAVRSLESETGQSIDNYVSQKLGWTRKQLAERFSAAQAEAVALFIHNLETRKTGLINSDQTGVGKGRSVAAAIHYALKNGKIPIFVTAKKQLYSDMAGRDLPAIGDTTFVPFITDSEVEWTNGKGEEIKHKKGAEAQREAMREITQTGKLPPGVQGIFTTYDQLKADKPQGWKEEPRATRNRKKNFVPRPDGHRLAMLRALAPNAVFILDEAHLAAGMDSETGLSLQSILPNAAGVYYASATFAKRPDNLSLYALGTAMKMAGLTRAQLGEVFTMGGVPLQQVMTSMLAESGEFVRREQNMEGVKFNFKSTGTDPEKEAELADTYTSFLRDLFQLSEQVNAAAQAEVDGDNQVRPVEESVELSNTNFGSRLFNLSSQYLFSLRADATIQEALAALRAGQKPFIAVYNTMAGPIADLQEKKLPLSFGGMLEREMLKMLEITVRDPLSPGHPPRVKRGTRKIILKPEGLPDGGRFYYQLRDQIRATDFSQMPISPIDTIKSAISKAGFTISEITGRKGEITEGDEPKLTKREILSRNKILSDFNNGATDAMIVNGSADTGVSAHTDPRFKDQRQRHMIIAQPNPDINGFMQIVGRVMRFGQTSVPVYTIVGSSLATERRFNTMLRAKLNSLNANTTADTESSITQGGLTADIFNAIGDQVVADIMSANVDLARLALIDLPDPTNPEGLTDYARRATGKFVLLPNADAEMLWTEIADTYNATIKALDDAGENPLKADVLDLRAKTTKSQTIQEGTGKTLFDGPVVLEQVDVRPPKPALTSEQAMELAEQGRAAAEQKAAEWLSKFAAARQQRLTVMRQREATPEQIDAAMANFERTKQAVEEALRFIGEPMAVGSTVAPGQVDFYAVPIGLMLKSNSIGDFSGASKHSVVLATNSIRRQVTIPLSQLARLEPSSVELFDSERDQSGNRHIVTGNLLRGIHDALKIARGTARPKVTIYSTADQQVKTGILMAPGWRPEDGLRALAKTLKTSDELKATLDSGKLVNAGPVLIRGNILSIPSRNEFRGIWSDPQFGRLFRTSPVERRGEFSGELTTYGRDSLFAFLKSKGLTASAQTVETQLDLKPTAPNIQLRDASPSDISRVDRAKAAVVGKLGSRFGNRPFRAVSPTLDDPSTRTSLGLGEDSRRAIETAFGQQLVFFDSDYPINGLILSNIPGTIFLNVRSRRPIPTVIFHEMMEWLRLNSPADYARFMQVIIEEAKADKVEAFGQMLETITGESVGRDEVLKEIGADLAAYESQRPDFWNRMAQRLGQAFLRIGQKILNWLNGVQSIRGFETSEFFRDVERVRNELANVMAKFVQNSSSPSASTVEGQAFFQLDDVFASRQSLDEFTSKPTISPEEAASLRQQAGARAALIPDTIADEIKALDPTDTVEKRIASRLAFVLRIHGLAPALEIRRILADPNLTDDLKDAAISAVLRQIEHIRIQTTEVDDELQAAIKNQAAKVKAMGKISGKQLTEAKAKDTVEKLIIGYRAYLTAQAAMLPADKNIAAARRQVILTLSDQLDGVQTLPSATIKALQAIALRIGELPVAQGPAAVIEAIRAKGILKGVAGDSTIDLLLDEKPSGLAPLLLNPQTNELLLQLAELQKKADVYAKQTEVFEQAFRGKGEPTPVEIKKWAETYRKFRNKQAEAAKAISEMDKAFREADENVQVYSRAKDILDRLQSDPSFTAQWQAVIDMPGGSIFDDIMGTPEDRTKVFTSPLKQVDADGKVTYNKYKVLLAPDRQADEQTMREMALLVHEVDEYLAGEVDPIERRTWQQRVDYIRKYQLIPMFSSTIPGWSFETGHGIIDLNPLTWVQTLLGGRARAPRSEAEKMTLRASDMVNTSFRVGDQALNGYRLIRNNREYGDEVSKIAVLEAVKSHEWDYTRIEHWNEWVLNPIIASGQAPGQMRLGEGDYIPGTGIKITKEDMRAARLEKRYSQGIVQTTQGTAQNLPPLLKDNPVLVESQFAGRPTQRRALGTGPLTMARRFSLWSRAFSDQWTKTESLDSRRSLLIDSRNFRFAVLGYVTTTNPEFEYESPLKSVYEEYASRARTNEDAQVQSLDQLVDRLAEIAVDKELFPDVATAMPQIEQTLIQETDRNVQAYIKQTAEQDIKGNSPQAIVAVASSKNAFTTARHQMVAPDTFYDYTLTSANDRIAFVAGGYQMFQAKQISALQDLKEVLDREASALAEEVKKLTKTGMSPRRARREVQQRTAKAQAQGELRFTYARLLQHKRVIDKLIDDLSKLVIDVRDPNDSAALLALSRFQSTLSSGLLATPMAMANNYFGGGIAAAFVTQQNLGRARMLLPLKSVGNLVSVLPRRLLASQSSQTYIGQLARSKMPLVRRVAKVLEETITNEIYFNSEAEAWGLRSPPDMRNRLKAAKELKGTAGQILFEEPSMLAKTFNWMESIPGLRQLLIVLRDVSPRVIDEQVNAATARTFQSENWGWLKVAAVRAFKAREELAKTTGADIADFTNQENLLTPEELGLSKSSGFRDINRLRQTFQLVGTLDGHLLDYYRRYNAAPEGEKAKVPLFEDSAAEGSVIFDMEAHGNIPTTGFTPPAMAGVGQTGAIKRLIFMFQNYVLRAGAQLERLTEKDLRDPRIWREAKGFWSLVIALMIFLFSGFLATETGVPLTRVVTGRAPSRVTAANVLSDPDAAILARYAGMALGNNFPYYGKVISEMLGNPGYGSMWDAANMIPIAGLVRDASIALKRINQTGDPIYPGLDFVSRWFPPASPAIRLLPGMEGDIAAKNAARALRVVGPSEGMELAGGGGGAVAQTPVTPEIRRLLSAAHQGDAEGVRRAFDAAVAAKERLGSPDPVRAVKQSLAAATPARRVFGRSITEAEERGLLSQMSAGQQADYAVAQDAFALINRTIGTNYRLTAAPPKLKTTGRRRRQLRGRASRLPSIRRSRVSRRSPLRRRRITGRRRRRNPSFSMAA